MAVEYLFIAVPVAAVIVLRILFKYTEPVKKMPVKMPGFTYTLIYSDARDLKKDVDSGILVSKEYGLRGKPDYIYRKKRGGRLVPVELKSGKINLSEPHKGDLMQLCAYFLIISEAYGSVPKYGFLVYKDYMFKVKNTKALKRELESIINDMRSILISGEIKESPNASYILCRHCICNGTVCEYF